MNQRMNEYPYVKYYLTITRIEVLTRVYNVGHSQKP